MSKLELKQLRFDRRELLRYSGITGFFAMSSLDTLLAQQICESPKQPETQAPGKHLLYWIDGAHFAQKRSDIPSRANVALYIDLPQTPQEFVESVYLTDAQGSILASRHYDASMKTSDGHLPYVIFENVTLSTTATYNIIFQQRRGTDAVLYLTNLTNPQRSTLNHENVPTPMRADLIGHIGDTPGLLTSPFQYYTWNGLDAHCARGRVHTLSSSGQFQIDIDCMHGDVAEDHYMRYFIVADPVGRILGFERRDYKGPKTGKSGNPAGSMMVSNLTEAQRQQLQIANTPQPVIAFCPYVQIFTEDIYDAMARTTLRLR